MGHEVNNQIRRENRQQKTTKKVNIEVRDIYQVIKTTITLQVPEYPGLLLKI